MAEQCLIDHLHITVRDLAAARRFYGAVLEALCVAVRDLPEKDALAAAELG